jgi:poly-gamma-glutamate synthase PgsB/CapB
LTVLFISLLGFVLYLVYERILLDRLRKSVPLVITVTGTRGKSTVVRLLASILREGGKVVLAKSTGSQAQFVLPDGKAENLHRRGMVSILEQKKALRKAVNLKADCLIAEIMSIRPENHFVESQQILKPDIVVLTNIRRDHTEAMGQSGEEIARVLQLDFADKAEVFVSQDSQQYLGPNAHTKRPWRLTVVTPTYGLAGVNAQFVVSKTEFAENLDLVVAVAERLKIDDATIVRGIRNAVHDIGRFRIWSLELHGKRLFAVNAFAANDPESTRRVLDKAREILGSSADKFTGLLNLRADRPDRTMQWIDALNSEMAEVFGQLYVLGGHANVVKRKVDKTLALRSTPPDALTRMIVEEMKDGGVIFGFGNIGGAGEQLVEYWQREGTEYGI